MIFATLWNYFGAATVPDVFFVSMSPIYYKGKGVFMKSSVVKRSIVVGGHKTSVSLEDAFWKGLKEIAGRRDISVSDLVAAIDSGRQHGNLSSAIRLFVLDCYRNQLSDPKSERDGTHEMSASAVAAFS